MIRFCVILSKNYLLFWRRWVQTLTIILIPLLLSLTLVFLRNQSTRTRIPTAVQWDPFAPSGLPYPPLFVHRWTLAYSPNSSLPSVIIREVGSILNLDIIGFSSEGNLLNFLRKDESYAKRTIGAVVFNISRSLNNVSYSIRLHNEGEWFTHLLYPKFAEGKPRTMDLHSAPPAYFSSGFLTIQSTVDSVITRQLCGNSSLLPSLNLMLKRMPYPAYLDDGFIPIIQRELSFVIVLGFMFPVLNAVRTVLVEKHGKMKESLKMLGMTNGTYWCSWLTAYLSLFAVICALVTVVLCSPLSSNGAILVSSNPLIIFILLMLYANSLLSFGFAISTFFDSPYTGTAVSCAILIVIYLPYTLLDENYNQLNLALKVTSAFLPSVGFGFVCMIIGQFEGVGMGAQFSSLFTPANPGDDLALSTVWIILLVQGKLFMLLALYVDAVWPGKYGVPRPWHFPVTCLCRRKPTVSLLLNDNLEGEQFNRPLRFDDPSVASATAVMEAEKYIETEPIGLPIGIALRDVRKVYKTKQSFKSAISGLTLNVFHGQITVMLGHNGAGKTTTLSILTGLFPPTSGTAFVGGHDIRKDIDGVRKSLGFCPQHDVFFRELTVEEHLKLVARLKGFHGAELSEQVEEILRQTHLLHKRNACAGTLSGGTRRRLSIGMALIGDSKVVILDEPTSGLDPEARRQIWTILQGARACRTVLVTTHYMDEADHLGDRIAILASGKLKCLGSPLFLKAKYGAGYLLTIVKQPETQSSYLLQHIQRHVGTALLRSEEGTEVKVLLPLDSVNQFAALFKELEEKKDELGVSSFGVSVTTMEEVFFRVSEQDDLAGPTFVSSAHSGRISRSISNPSEIEIQDLRNDGLALYWQQLTALLSKRGIYLLRHRILTLSQFVIPVGLSLVALLIFRHLLTLSLSDELCLPLSLQPYGDKLVVTYSNELTSPNSSLSEQLLNAYVSQFDPSRVTSLRMDKPNTFEDNLINQVAQPKLFDYRNRFVIGLVAQPPLSDPTVNLTVRAYFQGESFHAAPISLNALTNGLLRLLVNRASTHTAECPALSAQPPHHVPTVTTFNHPLPKTEAERVGSLNSTEGLVKTLIAGIPLVSNLLLAMSYLAASFALPLIHEYTTNAKHLQFVSGVKLLPYWLANYLWDMFMFILCSGVILCVFAIFDLEAFDTKTRLYLVALLFLLYAWAVLPEMYLLGRFFKSPTSGLVWLTVWNDISAIIGLLVVALLCYPSVHRQELSYSISYFWMAWSPTFALADGLFTIFENYQFRHLCDRPDIKYFCLLTNSTMPCCLKTCDPFCAYWTSNNLAFTRGGIGPNACALVIHGMVFGLSVLFCDCTMARRLRLVLVALFNRLCYEVTSCGRCPERSLTYECLSTDAEDVDYLAEDEDVRQHRHLIGSMPLGRLKIQTCLAFCGVSKTFSSALRNRAKPSVDHITFAVLPGECFGLLGVNGAGKTTIFRMLTGDLDPTSGLILVNGFDLNSHLHKAQQSIGYCPQFDALLPYLTGRETLQMYARLRGLQEDIVSVEVNQLLTDLNLDHYADVLVSHYSGGKKRKLSVAVALIGGTPLVCLDEPTTGVDPVSRRRMWNILIQIRRQGRTLILSSHSMEECEALCSRVSIVVNGQLKCLGTCQHLKARFGGGYTVALQVATPAAGQINTAAPLSFAPDTADSMSSSVVTEAHRVQQLLLDDAVSQVNQFVQLNFPCARLVSRHQGVLQYHLPISLMDSLLLSTIFHLIESNKNTLNLINYSVSQTTMEHVFIGLAKSQSDPVETVNELTYCSDFNLRKWCRSCCRCSLTLANTNRERQLMDESEQESLFL